MINLAMICRIFVAILACLAFGLALIPFLDGLPYRIQRMAAFLPFAIPVAILCLFFAIRLKDWAGGIISMMALGLCALIILPELYARPRPLAPGSEDLTIVTHNMAARNRDPERTMAILLASGADILLLQESHGAMSPLLPELDHIYPFHMRCDGCELAIYSRYPLTAPTREFAHMRPDQVMPALQWASVDIPGKGRALLATTHLSWRNRDVWREDGEHLIEVMGQIDTSSLILAGDFNLSPWQRAMHVLDTGLQPLTRITRAQFSFPSRLRRFAVPIPFLPIDHMFVGTDWQPVSVERLGATGSDHYPLKIRLRYLPHARTR
jgi:endonuclease/exonuclease/phosphatase (EEP) superfamily protein YafD